MRVGCGAWCTVVQIRQNNDDDDDGEIVQCVVRCIHFFVVYLVSAGVEENPAQASLIHYLYIYNITYVESNKKEGRGELVDFFVALPRRAQQKTQ